jgi:hypothetical protein
MMEHQNDGIVRDIPSVMIGVKNDHFRTCLVQRKDQATGRMDPEIFCWSIGFKVVSDQWVYACLRNTLRTTPAQRTREHLRKRLARVLVDV